MEAEDETRGRMPPIKVKFEIPYFTVSGIQVRRGGCLPVACKWLAAGLSTRCCCCAGAVPEGHREVG